LHGSWSFAPGVAERLARVEREYDPDGPFRDNHVIEPA
jgi:hypothetical protein